MEEFAMVHITQKAQCCGCTACSSICPKNCINMVADGEGFAYPQVDAARCVDCHLCERACPLLHRPPQHELLGVYGAKNRDRAVRRASSSGGVFSLLAQEILGAGGTVFGAAFDENFQVYHRAVQSVDELALLRGSKYVQSDLRATFREVRALLRSGRPVLYSGTPCQIAGLHGFVPGRPPGLYTVDCLCHGIPSPRVYKQRLAEIAAEAGGAVTEVRFRDKGRGWKHGETLFLAAGQVFGASKRRESYMRLFLNNLSIRPCCGDCAFNNKRSLADITIGDYWGVDQQFPEFDDDLGVTLVFINTEKGRGLFNAIGGQLDCLETDFAQGAAHNYAVAKTLQLHPRRAEFFARLGQQPLTQLADELLGPLPPKTKN